MTEVVFDERIARSYDARSPEVFTPEVLDPTVALLGELAGDGRALELAVGTGRVALPLSQRGVPVSGIDISPPMVEQMRAKPGAEAVAVTIGDMTTTRVDGSFRLVYLVFNTIMNLTTQDAQVACFANAAAHLESGGTFVVECVVPALRLVPPGKTSVVFFQTDEHVGIEEYRDMTHGQIAWSHHHVRADDGTHELFSAPYRYVWPAELDLMAQIAGMRLRARWADWARSPFTGESTSHVSVWEKL